MRDWWQASFPAHLSGLLNATPPNFIQIVTFVIEIEIKQKQNEQLKN